MGYLSGVLVRVAILLALVWPHAGVRAADWMVAGSVLTPTGILADGVIAISDKSIVAVGAAASVPGASNATKLPGIILPGFIDLHNHLTWNVLPRWIPGRKFNNRYEWQDSPEYDRLLVAPHNAVLAAAACESQIFAEVKAIVGGATSVVGSLLPTSDHPNNADCAIGLARNLDVKSGLPFKKPDASDDCIKKFGADETLIDVVDNEVFPLELPHERMGFLLCELSAGSLNSLIVHLSEGAAGDASARREFAMLRRQLLQKDGKPISREGLVLIHGTALRDQDFIDMSNSKVGLIWSPRSNDELYGSTANIAAARIASVRVAIAPDWSPSGSAGMLQEIGYAARRYGAISSADLVAMATSVPAQLARVSDHIGALAPGKLADFVVINAAVDPTKPRPLDPVVRATPADIVLVVVGGQPVYGDSSILAQMLPAGAKTEQMPVCGATKSIYLGESNAPKRGQTLADIKTVLSAALARASSSLPDIECD